MVVIGASAGGLEVVREIVRGLPTDLPAAVLIVVHVSPSSPGLLPAILGQAGSLPAAYPTDGDQLECGRVYVAPPNQHLLVENCCVRLGGGPRENGFRPAIDPLFRSAAVSAGVRVIGVLCSGAMDDGTAGLAAIKEYGGTAVVQDPRSAVVQSMPRSAIRNVAVDYIVEPADIAPLLTRLARDRTGDAPTVADRTLESEVAMSKVPDESFIKEAKFAVGHTARCPDCGGPMHEVGGARVIRFRCHEGHAYTAGSLLAKQAEENVTALRQTVSLMREQVALGRRLAERASEKGDALYAKFLGKTADRLQQRAEVLQQILDATETDGDLAAEVE